MQFSPTTDALPRRLRERNESPADARRRVSRRGPAALVAMLVPAILFPVGLVLLRDHARFTWIRNPSLYPWELWTLSLFGIVATIGGILDWALHRGGETAVGKAEHRTHLLSLTLGGIPMFCLMSVASIIARPANVLLPVLIVLIVTVVLVCYDEFVFHRRCGWRETLFHRMLTLGNGVAWLAWAHWCFVRGGAYA